MRRISITGPVERTAEYAEAARRARWAPIELPLLRIAVREAEVAARDMEGCELACVTSSNALSALDGVRLPALVVGGATSERARAMGLSVSAVAADAGDLARIVLALVPRPMQVLWPRGDQSDELARQLRAHGIRVIDPVVYASVPVAPSELPDCEAVFFASPSAVRAWLAHPSARTHAARVAIAIGPTTVSALHSATGARFEAILSLREPSPSALEEALDELAPHP